MATITSAGTGLASVGATWVGGTAPVLGDKVIVAASHVVTLDGDIVWGDDSTTAITINGTVSFSRTANTSLRCRGQLIIDSGGWLDMGTIASPIPVTYTATLYLNDSASLAHNEWGLYTQGNDPKVTVCGNEITRNTNFTAVALTGQPEVVLADVTGWKIGDEVIFSGCGDSANNTATQYTTVAGIVSNTVTLAADVAGMNRVIKTPISNLSSNVEIRSYNLSYRSYINIFWDSTPTVENDSYIRHARIRVGGGGTAMTDTTWKQPSIAIHGERNSGRDYQKVSDITGCAILVDASLAGNFIGVGRLKGITIEDCALACIDLTVNRGQSYLQDSAPAVFQSCHFYNNAYCINSGNSSGAVSARFYDCYLSGSVYPLTISSGFSMHFYDCYFGPYSSCAIIGNGQDIRFIRCDMGVTLGTQTSGGRERLIEYIYSAKPLSDVKYQDCMFVAHADFTTNLSRCLPGHKVVVSNKNVDPLIQEIYTPTGNLYRDNTFSFDAGGTSLRMEPTNANSPVEFSVWIFAPNGKPVVASGYVYKNSSYGSSNQPTVTIEGLGETDTWTAEDIADTWQQFKVAITQNTGADGMVELVFSAQATTGAVVYIDGVTAPASTAVQTGEFGYWADGLPAPIVTANFVSAADVWNILTSQLTLEGSAGALLVAMLDAAISTRLASTSYTSPPAATANATAVRAELATELSRVDAAISTRLADADYVAPDNATISSIDGKADTIESKIDDTQAFVLSK